MATAKLSEISKKNGDLKDTVTVEKIENGFLVTKRCEGYKGTGKNRDWFYEEKKYFSETDPLEGAEKELADFFD